MAYRDCWRKKGRKDGRVNVMRYKWHTLETEFRTTAEEIDELTLVLTGLVDKAHGSPHNFFSGSKQNKVLRVESF